ncbi:hypothetical protein DL93DRAFT_2181438 [Clavulina sp. PMI_390]|nr:hypothetical protein DL93DRAFT_2181438 [Clavulina sp. PMI_390]
MSSVGAPPSIADTENDDEPDEFYDWSDEEDLVDQEAKFEAKIGKRKKAKTWGTRRIATFLFSTLIGTTFLTCVLVAVPITLHFVYYRPHPTQYRTMVTDNVSAWFYWAAANLLISWYLAVIIDVIPHIATWFVKLSWGTLPESFKTKIGLYDSIKGWIKPVFYAASAWVSWVIIFANIFGLHNTAADVTSDAAYTDRMVQVVELCFFIVLLYCIEKIALQFVAFTFHRVAYQDRLNDVNKALKVFDHLKDYRPKTRRRTPGASTSMAAYTADTDGEHDSDYFSRSAKPKPMPRPKRHGTLSPEREYSDRDDSGTEKKKRRTGPSRTNSQDFNTAAARAPRRQGTNDSYSPRGRHHSRGGSPAGSGSNSPHTYPPTSDAHLQAGGNGNRRSARNSTDGQILATAAKALKTVVLHDARNIKGKDTTDADASFTITSPHEAKKLARNLYMAFRASKKRTHLIPSDFYPAYPRQEDAKEAFQIFDKDGNENITRAEIKTTIMKVYKERRFLARSLKDVGAALVTLDWIMLAAATVMLFFIALSVFNVQITKLLTSFYTLGIALSFIFKNSAANGFDAVMFLFVSHPFDTGDRCFINGENLVVKKMGLFATIFTRSDGTHTYYFNTQLTNVFIINARRSNKSAESCTIQIDWRTPLSKIDELEKAMNHWIDTDENRWFNTTSIMLQSISYQRSLEMTIGIAHNSNWQDWGQALTRRTAFHAAVNHYCREIGITFSNSPQPVYFTKPGADQPVSAEEMEWEDEPQSARLGIPETSAGTGLGLGRSSTRAGAALRREASTAGGVLPRVPPALFFQPPKDDLAGLRKRKKADGGAANC